MRKRVVVTGMGVVTPLGHEHAQVWSRLLAGESGISTIHPPLHSVVKIGGQVKDFSEELLTKTERKQMSRFMQFGAVASHKALVDAQLDPHTLHQRNRDRFGVCIGSGIGSVQDLIEAQTQLISRGERRVSPFMIPKILINLCAGNISIKYGLRGPNHSASTACTTGAHSIGDAARFIEYGDADLMLAGGTEASFSQLALAGFHNLRALSTQYSDNPTLASRPFDKERSGFVMGEGAGIVVLEVFYVNQELNHALERKARIYAELTGYGLSGDAFHLTSPPEDGNGAQRAMKRAVEVASRYNEVSIDYVNAHATSTPIGDAIELKAIQSVFGDGVVVSSTKGATGHLLGAAGAIEAIFTIQSVHTNCVPPTLNLQSDIENQRIIHVPQLGRDFSNIARRSGKGYGIECALTNSFGFGGTNASLVFQKFKE